MNKVVHVVPFLSPDMRFGGPVRVALNLATEQQKRGDSVEVVGAGELTGELQLQNVHEPGVHARAFKSIALMKGRPFTSRISLSLWIWILRNADRAAVLHLHMGRDPVSLIAGLIARRSKTPFVVQTHGMIERRRGVLGALDKLVVGPILKSARHTLALTSSEAEYLRSLSGSQSVSVFPNGTLVTPYRKKSADSVQVLFLARLHPRKGASQFARVACVLSSRHPQLNLSFLIAGPDEGDLAAVRRIIAASPRVYYVGSRTPSEAEDLMNASHIYVLPASGEPFGMTILEALATSNAVVLSQTAALAPALTRAGAAVAFDGSDGSLADIIEDLISDAIKRETLGSRGREFVIENFSIRKSVLDLQRIYNSDFEGTRD